MKRKGWFWVLAVAITLLAIFFQRQTGPTYPKKISFEVDTVSAVVKLPRSGEVNNGIKIAIPAVSLDYTVKLYYRPYPSNADWSELLFWPEDDNIITYLPEIEQRAAKIEYYLAIEDGNEVTPLPEEPIVLRYKGSVPAWALIPHIILIFVGLIFSNLAGVMALFNHNRFKFWAVAALLLILVGGLIFGPIVQKFAFGEYWTGFPFGKDLTDNKTLIMFIVWLVAVAVNWKRPNRWVTITAAVIAIAIYCIPHSLRGSEFNYETGEIVTGFITRTLSLF